MKNIENKCMLITYADSMGKNLKALAHILDKHFSGVFGGVHVLPFFPPPATGASLLSTTTQWIQPLAAGRTLTIWRKNTT